MWPGTGADSILGWSVAIRLEWQKCPDTHHSVRFADVENRFGNSNYKLQRMTLRSNSFKPTPAHTREVRTAFGYFGAGVTIFTTQTSTSPLNTIHKITKPRYIFPSHACRTSLKAALRPVVRKRSIWQFCAAWLRASNNRVRKKGRDCCRHLPRLLPFLSNHLSGRY